MAAGVKIAGFAALARILVGALSVHIESWAPALAVIAAISVIVGTGFAIAQDDLKRMLAYSGVAHAGFIMTALVDGEGGLPAMWFYVVTYAIELVGVFTIIAVVGGYRRGAFKTESLAGLSQRSPSLALAMTVLMLGLAGIPLTAGFVSKFVVFAAAIDAGYVWLVVVGLVTAVGGLYFYLRTIAVMYFKSPVPADAPGTARAGVRVGTISGIVIWLAVAATVITGIDPWPLLELARHALPL
jgi:NADH-quinone oxidoreductase subunit N